MGSNTDYNKTYYKKISEERKAFGLCIGCGKEKIDGHYCQICRDKKSKSRKKKYIKDKISGLCVMECTCTPMIGKNLCLKHFLQNTSQNTFGSTKHWKELEELLKNQNFRCALTSDSINFDSDIELDHIFPKSIGGENIISNLRWVTKNANRMKHNMTDDELVEMCNKVIETLS